MALSDRDQTVLREMEEALRADTTRSSTPRRALANHGAFHYLRVAIGLAIAGAVAIAVGLPLEGDVGTGLGVLGFLFIVGSAWSATHLLPPLRSERTTQEGKTRGPQ
jgi:hypothetical protein